MKKFFLKLHSRFYTFAHWQKNCQKCTSAQCLNLLEMGRKKSKFFKNGVKPLLWTLLATHNSNLIFGPICGPILGHFWAQKAKKSKRFIFLYFLC